MNNENATDVIIGTNTENAITAIGVEWRKSIKCSFHFIREFQPLFFSFKNGLTCLLISCSTLDVDVDVTVDVMRTIILSLATSVLIGK